MNRIHGKTTTKDTQRWKEKLRLTTKYKKNKQINGNIAKKMKSLMMRMKMELQQKTKQIRKKQWFRKRKSRRLKNNKQTKKTRNENMNKMRSINLGRLIISGIKMKLFAFYSRLFLLFIFFFFNSNLGVASNFFYSSVKK